MKVDKSKWKSCSFGEICNFKRGLTYPKSEESQNPTKNIVLRSNNIDLETHALVLNELKYLNSSYSIPSDKLITNNSILMCMSNGSLAHIGKVAFIDKDYSYAFGGFMGLIIPLICPKFLYYKFRSSSFKSSLSQIGNGINITNLKFSSIASLPILVPSQTEQEAIAAELDALQEVIDGYREQITDLDTLAQSIFRDTFGDPVPNPKGWNNAKFSDLFSLKSGDGLSAKQFEDGKFPVYGGNGIAGYHNKYNRCGEYVIIGRVGAKCGNVRHINGTFWLTDNAFELIQKKNEYDNIFLSHLLSLLDLGSKAKKMAQPVISNVSLKDINVILPSHELQQQFASRVEVIEKQKDLLRQQLADAEMMMAERMQYYFS